MRCRVGNRIGNGIGNRLRGRLVRGWGNVLWDRDRRLCGLWQREVVGEVRNMVLDRGRWRLWHHLLGEVEGRDLVVGVDGGNMVRDTLRRHLVRKVEASGVVRTHGEMLT